MWPGWLMGARVAGVGTAAFGSVRAGMPGPYGELKNRGASGKVTHAGIEKPGPRVQRTAGQKQPRGLFLGREIPHGRKLMWPGWLA